MNKIGLFSMAQNFVRKGFSSFLANLLPEGVEPIKVTLASVHLYSVLQVAE
jgi:hypothetical protein